MNDESKNTLITGLWDRKVPQYLGTYFAIGFGLLQFVEFISERYDFNKHLVDKYLLVWLALIPAIATLIYFGGKLNPATATGIVKWPKFLVLGNVTVALLLGGFLFNGEVFAESEIIELTDENGKKINALIPALTKVKTVACFQFENLTGDHEEDWWGVAFSYLLQLNLDQKPEFYTSSQYELTDYYDRLGLKAFTIPSVGMQKEIAQNSRNDYFSRISYAFEDNKFVFKGNLYNAKDGKSIVKINVVNEDPYAAIDIIKQNIYDHIPDPIAEAKNQSNLPASSLITSNTEALKYLTESGIAFNENPDALKEVTQLALKSVEIDPTCSLCHLSVASSFYNQGLTDEGLPYLKNAIKYGASLPERMQFAPKEALYGTTNNIDAFTKLQELRRKMFPYEFRSYERLLPLYITNKGIDSSKALMQEAINNGNLEKGLLALYNLQLNNEEYEEAKNTLDRFSSEFPDRDQDKDKYANIYEKQGKIKEAKEILLELETLDPLSTDIQTTLAYLDFKNLDIVGANKRVDRGIQQATTLSDSLNFIWIKAYFLRMSGQIDKAIQTIAEYEKHAKRRTPHGRLIQSTFNTKTDIYQSIGQSEKVDELIAEISKYSPEFEPMYNCMASTSALEKNYEVQIDKDSYTGCLEVYESYGEGYVEYFDVMNSYLLGEYKNCIAILDKNGKRVEQLFNKNFLASIYTKSGNLNKAKEIIKKIIDQKTDNPVYYYEMAVLLEKEDKKASKKHLEIALKYWSDADSDYIPLKRAKTLAGRLRQ